MKLLSLNLNRLKQRVLKEFDKNVKKLKKRILSEFLLGHCGVLNNLVGPASGGRHKS